MRYGGQLHLQPPASDAGERKTYSIALMVGNERHEIDVVQEAAQQLNLALKPEPM